MKKIFLAVLPLCMLLFASCEKVVNIDLNESDPQYVIDGVVMEGENPVRIFVNKTTDFYGRQPQAPVSDATITIGSPDGTVTTVPHVGGGFYELPVFNAMAGSTYTLKVQAEGKEFTASTRVPAPVPFDSITTEYNDGGFGFFDPGYNVVGYITDPIAEANNYRVIMTVNDTIQDDIDMFDDKFNNGKLIDLDPFDRFQIGDTITMELRTMDRPVFEFFTTLNDALNNGQGPAPANPNTNIKGGALGYFGGFGVSKIGVRIRE